MHQHLGLALGLQAVKHALHPQGLARQHGLGQLEHVIACHIEHSRLHLLKAQLALGVQQCELLNLLVRGQQVAFYTVGKKLQGALPGFTRLDALLLLCQPLGNPHRQGGAFQRFHGQADPVVVQRCEPGGGPCGLVQARQQHQEQGAITLSQ